jgi:hypothetical protein
MRIKTAPPTIHTHGSVYQVEVVVVVSVVTLVLLFVLSCPKSASCIKLKKKVNRNVYAAVKPVFFILLVFCG